MKAKKLKMPREVAKKMGVDVDAVNAKLQAIVDRKKGMSIEEIIESDALYTDYDNFTKEECLALFMDAAAEAGFLKFKLDMLIKAGAIDPEKFEQVMGRRVSDDINHIEDELGLRPDFL